MKLDGIEKQKQTIDENDLVSQIQVNLYPLEMSFCYLNDFERLA